MLPAIPGCAIIRGNLDVWIVSLVQRFGCAVHSSRARTAGDLLEGVESVRDKGQSMLDLYPRCDHLVAIGDGVNDMAVFEVSNFGGACGIVRPPAHYLVQAVDFDVN